MTSIHVTTASPLPNLSEKDKNYIRENYLSVYEVCFHRKLSSEDVIEAMLSRKLPLPSYIVDGELMVPANYFTLLDEAGSFAKMQGLFQFRFLAAARSTNLREEIDAKEAWNDFLTGELGVCLWYPSPETMVAKILAITNIQQLALDPQPTSVIWKKALRIWVKRLDLIERPFADADEIRFEGRTSRSKWIDDMRETYPHAFT